MDQYFLGEVNDKIIRIKNANRNSKKPSPTFDIFLTQEDSLTQVVIRDDTLEQIALVRTFIITCAAMIGSIIFIIGMVFFITTKDFHMLKFTLTVVFLIVIWALLSIYVSKIQYMKNCYDDRTVLTRLFKR